jgi:hypothetical protein
MGQFQRNSFTGPYILTTTSPRFAPSFYHDPTSLQSRGLYTEEGRTNIVRQSEAFGTTWTQAAVIVASNDEISPSGDRTAERLIENTVLTPHGVAQNITYTATPHTFSIYAKAGTRNWIRLGFGNPGSDSVWFDLANGVIGTRSPAFSTASSLVSMENVGNGWWRCAVTRIPTAGSLSTFLRMAIEDNTITYTGNGTGHVFIWGAQVEAGAFVTRYIPTTTANVVRGVDVCDINGSGFAEMYNPLEGTLCVSAIFNAPKTYATAQMLVDINDTTVLNRLRIFRQASTGYPFLNNSSNSTDSNVSIGGVSSIAESGIIQKYSAGFKQNDYAFYANNELIGVDNAGDMPISPTTLTIGDASSGFASRLYTNGIISSIRYYRCRLPNPKLQALTT